MVEKKAQKAAEEELQIMQLRWSVMNLYGVCSLKQKALQREADISVTGKGDGALWVTLSLPLWAKSRAQTRQTQLNVPVTRLGPFVT